MNPFWLVVNSTYVNITDFILSKLRYPIFTESKLLSLFYHSIVQESLSCCTSCTAMLPLPLPLGLCVAADCLKMVNLTTSTAFLAIHGALLLLLPSTTILTVLYPSLISTVLLLPVITMLLPFHSYESNSFASLILSNTSFGTCCVFLLAHINVCLFLTSMVSFRWLILL